jgi:iron complex outermembrane receptor protein
VQPIQYPTTALNNPIYRDLVMFNPTVDAQNQAIDEPGTLFANLSNGTYDPANVVAIVYSPYQNVARQAIHGVDVSAEYGFDIGQLGRLTATGLASYLHSTQQLSSGQPTIPLAGTIFNPPHFRARGGLIWNQGSATLTSYVNYIGGLADIRSAPSIRVGSMTTIPISLSRVLAMARKPWLVISEPE